MYKSYNKIIELIKNNKISIINNLDLESTSMAMEIFGGAGAVALIGCAVACIYVAYKKSEQ